MFFDLGSLTFLPLEVAKQVILLVTYKKIKRLIAFLQQITSQAETLPTNHSSPPYLHTW